MAEPLTVAAGIGWGMRAAGWIASPIISELFKKAYPYLGFDAPKRLSELETKILLLEQGMEMVEESPHRNRLQQLFEDLKSAFYEAEEILDDVEYYRLKKQIKDTKMKPDSDLPPRKRDWVKKKLQSAMPSSPLKDQESGMSKTKLKKSLDKIEKVINDTCEILERINLPSIINANRSHVVAASSRGAVTTATPPLVVIGRDEDCEKIAAMLHEAEEDGQPNTNSAQRYSVIGIHGIGGSGKSTLAQLVCDREEKDGHFDLVMWVHVTQSFSVDTIFKMMFNAATGTSCPQFDNPDTLEVNLKKKLRGKRFLLVLDDVWFSTGDLGQYEKLQKILTPLNAGEAGSKILVTSRTEDALIALGAAERRRILIPALDEDVFLKLFMHYALRGVPIDDHVRRTLEDIGKEIAKKLKGSPLAARTVGGQLRMRTKVDFWISVRDRDILNETMGALWWSYRHLDEQVRRCFVYCSIFPRRRGLERDELVRLWAAAEFARITNEGEDTEDIWQKYFDDLVSASFLQIGVKKYHLQRDFYIVHDLLRDLAEKVAGSDYFRFENNPGVWGGSEWLTEGSAVEIPPDVQSDVYIVHDLLRDLAEKVAGSDHFRIENHRKLKASLGKMKAECIIEGSAVEVPPDVQHVFVQNYDATLITEKICKLKNIRSLIIDSASTAVEEKVLESMFVGLKKLRVLSITMRGEAGEAGEKMLSVPASVGQLRHLRYLAFRTKETPIWLVLPSTLCKLYHLQVLHFGPSTDYSCCECFLTTSCEDWCDLINLRHVINCENLNIRSIGRLTSLRTMGTFMVRKEQGYQLKQLRNLNKLCGDLEICGLENVESKEKALEANLADKEGLRSLRLRWNGEAGAEVETEVLEGLCPPKHLDELTITNYKGLRYPSWMVGEHDGGPKYLKKLVFQDCIPELGPEFRGFGTHLRVLCIDSCGWVSLPDCMEHLTSLHDLFISRCSNIRSLPALPQSLQRFCLDRSCNDVLISSCKIIGDPNWEKIQHIPLALIGVEELTVGTLFSKSPNNLKLLMAEPLTVAAGIGWGMRAAGWIASPIISVLFKKAYPYLGFDAPKRLSELETKILLLERVMGVVEESPHRNRLQQLFEDLKSAFYEAEEILDDVEYYRLKKQIKDTKMKPDSDLPPRKRDWVKKKLQSAMPSSPLKDQESGMSKTKLKQSLDKIEKVINDTCKILERMNLPSIVNANRSHAVALSSRGAVTTARPPLVVIGRDEDCDKITALLHEMEEDALYDTKSAQRYSVMGIHGIGGSGKSTLAQLVCDREKKDGHFDLVMWVHVTQNFSVDTIFRMMFNAATGTSCPQFDNPDTLEVKLEKELYGKRFLLVLDDVWYSTGDVLEHEKLQKILTPLNAGEAGSKILVTSRTEDALIALGAAEWRRILIPALDEDVFLKLFMHYAFPSLPIDDHVRRTLEDIGKEIAKKLKGSPLAARTVGGQLRMRTRVDFWISVRDREILNETMGALWWSYRHLDEQVRRCFVYCSIFPRGRSLKRDELVRLWAAAGFARITNEGEDTEDICQKYFDDLVSASFLQIGVEEYEVQNDYYIVHDLLRDLAEKVAGSDHFRFENHRKLKASLGKMKAECIIEGSAVEVPPDVQHVFVQTYDATLITEKICKLKNIRSLIIDSVSTAVEEKVFESMFVGLKKLRVLSMTMGREDKEIMLSVPASVGQLRHLRYLAFRTTEAPIWLVLPSTLCKLYHLQVLHFGYGTRDGHCEDWCDLINLRHVNTCEDLNIQSIGRLTSLRTMGRFMVRKEQGYQLKQLRNLNKLGGNLEIHGVENVESKAEALEANLADKEGLRRLWLQWDGEAGAEVETEVLEGLCPPKHLDKLTITNYKGLRYPSWMVGEHDGGPKYLKDLTFQDCIQELGPELRGFGTHLCVLSIDRCGWVSLPDCMEHLTSLHDLFIFRCSNIRSLPTLPQSLQSFWLHESNNHVLISSCKIIGDPNWEKIRHIPLTRIGGCSLIMGVVTEDPHGIRWHLSLGHKLICG